MASSTSWASRAALSSALRYGPQREGLADLLRQAQEQFQGSVQAGKSEGTLASQAVAKTRPEVQGAFDRAAQSGAAARAQLAQQLAALGGGRAGAAANENAYGEGKLARERAHAEADLGTQQIAAAELPASTRQAALAQLLKSLNTIGAKRQALAGSEGAATQAELQRLEDEQRKEDKAERQRATPSGDAKLAAQTSRQNTKETNQQKREAAANKNNGPGGVKQLSTKDQTTAASTLRAIEHEARELRDRGTPRQSIYGELTSAHSGVNVPKTDAQGHPIHNSKGEPLYEKQADLPAHDVLLTEAALDSVFGYGRVSKPIMDKLHNAGYSIKQLGLEGPAPAKPKRKPTTAQKIGQAVGGAGKRAQGIRFG